MSESTLSEPTCDFCEKDGLPILPARLAIAPKNANAPKAEGAMLAGDAANIPLGEHAHYTTRILRSGYLYMYDEARKYWSAWFITDGAFHTIRSAPKRLARAIGGARAMQPRWPP